MRAGSPGLWHTVLAHTSALLAAIHTHTAVSSAPSGGGGGGSSSSSSTGSGAGAVDAWLATRGAAGAAGFAGMSLDRAVVEPQ